jgi:phospholipid/cholesterol/gamma-HCH transport system substrate-binding protein
MPRTRSLAWSELKIGILGILAIVVAATTIFLVTGSKGFSWQRYTLKTQFDSAPGLKSGSPVRIAGIDYGTVDRVELVGEKVDVTFEINEAMRDRVTTGSVATLGSVSLLGESAVDITPSTSGMPIPDGGYVPTGPPAAALADLTDRASQGIEEITGLIHDMRHGRGTAGKLITDEQLYTDLQQFVATAGELTRGIRDGRGTLGRLATDPTAANALEASLTTLERMTAQIDAGQGSIGKLLKDDAFAISLNSATTNIRELTGKLNRGEGTAGKLITDDTLFVRLNGLAGRFDELMTRLNAGEGTAGRLLKDDQLYENMNLAVADLRNLLAAIQKDPKKYLNVKISIF